MQFFNVHAVKLYHVPGKADPAKEDPRVKALPPYLFARINALLHQKRKSGDDVIDLGMGNPSDPPQELVIEQLAKAARDPNNHGYSKSNGILNLRREVAAKYARKYGVRLDPESEIIACLGSKEGFSHMCLALIGPGDNVISPAPFFPVHMHAVHLAAGNVITLEVADSDKFLSNIAYTCEHLYPKPKLLIINYPHNPSCVTMASPGTVCPAKVRVMRFSGVPAWRSRNVSDQGQAKPALAGRRGETVAPSPSSS